MRARRELLCIAAIVLLALALRVAHVAWMRASPLFDAPTMDALYHVEWARALARGEDFQEGPFFRAPLYPWFLAGVFRLFGEGLLLPRLLQALFGAATCYLVHSIGRRAFDPRVGLVAALFAATNWVLIYFDGELLIETLAVPLYLLGLRLTLELWAEPVRLRTALLAGAAFGLSALVRPNILLLMPFLACWVLGARGPRWRQGLFPAAALAVGTLLPILPVSAYNTFVGKDAVLISTQGGVNFWIGNNPESDGSSAIVPGTRPGWWEGYHDAIAQAEALEGRALRPSEVSRHYTRRAWSWILGSPAESIPHQLWKLRLFLSQAELGNNADERFFAHHFNPLIRFLPTGFALLAPLGLLGLALSLGRAGMARAPLALYFTIYSLSVIGFFVCSRFRVPVLPVLAIYAGHTLVFAFDRFRARRMGVLIGLGAAWVALLLVVRSVPAGVDTSDSMGLWQLGIHELERGRAEQALPLLERAVAENPRSWFARKDLGLALCLLGRFEPAAEQLEVARSLSSSDVAVLAALVEVHLRAGRPAQAVEVAREAARRRPDLSLGLYEEGRAQVALGDLAAARRAWSAALDLDPEHFHAGLFLGLLELESEQPAQAALRLERALRSPQAGPAWLPAAYEGLMRAQLALGQAQLAREVLDEARARLPHDPRVANLQRLLGP